MPQMRENDILQLISQYLHEKYPEITNKLPVCVEDRFSDKQLNEAVMDGRWDDILNQIDQVRRTKIDNGDDGSVKRLNTGKFKIFEQKVQESLLNKNQTQALEILRNNLSPMKMFPDRIHQLAQNILLSKADPKDRVAFAQELFIDLKSVPGLLIVENRLEELVEQAVEYQILKCPYHYNRDVCDIWYDHQCSINGPILLQPKDLVSKRIEIPKSCPGDLFNLFLSPDNSTLTVLNDAGAVAIFARDSEGDWKCLKIEGYVGEGTPSSVWPKHSWKIPGINFVHNNDEQGILQFTNDAKLLESNTISIAYMPDTDQVIKSTEGQCTVLYDSRQDRVIHSWVRLRCSHILTPAREDERYFFAAGDNGDILQISTESFEIMRKIPTMNERLQVSAAYLDEDRLLVGYNDSTIYYYEDWLNYEHPTRIFRGHKCTTYRVNSILSRYDRNTVLSCSENGSIYVWKIESGRLIFEIKIHKNGTCVNDIIEIGKGTFVTCGDGNELYEWTLPN